MKRARSAAGIKQAASGISAIQLSGKGPTPEGEASRSDSHPIAARSGWLPPSQPAYYGKIDGGQGLGTSVAPDVFRGVVTLKWWLDMRGYAHRSDGVCAELLTPVDRRAVGCCRSIDG